MSVDPGQTAPFRSFWDRAYEAGDHRRHWEPPEVPPELVAAIEGGRHPEGLDLERLRWPERPAGEAAPGQQPPGAGPGDGAGPVGGRPEASPPDSGLTVVDLGCGTGLEAVWLAERGFRVAGVDDSRVALRLARARAARAGVCDRVRWHHASVFDLPFPHASVGLALDRGCFHALHPEDRHLYADELARVLAPGSPLLLRGAAHEDEEAGLWPVDEIHVALFFPAPLFHRGPLFPVPLESRTETLPGHGTWLTRR